MTSYTVQLGYALYYFCIRTVEGRTLTEALNKAIVEANDCSGWSSTDVCGNTFVDAVAEGAGVDLWSDDTKQLAVPSYFAEGGEGPRMIASLKNAKVLSVEIPHGTARLEIRCYDTDGIDPDSPYLLTDAKGETYLACEWSNVIPTAEAAE